MVKKSENIYVISENKVKVVTKNGEYIIKL